jgi:hypothetical protein
MLELQNQIGSEIQNRVVMENKAFEQEQRNIGLNERKKYLLEARKRNVAISNDAKYAELLGGKIDAENLKIDTDLKEIQEQMASNEAIIEVMNRKNQAKQKLADSLERKNMLNAIDNVEKSNEVINLKNQVDDMTKQIVNIDAQNENLSLRQIRTKQLRDSQIKNMGLIAAIDYNDGAEAMNDQNKLIETEKMIAVNEERNKNLKIFRESRDKLNRSIAENNVLNRLLENDPNQETAFQEAIVMNEMVAGSMAERNRYINEINELLVGNGGLAEAFMNSEYGNAYSDFVDYKNYNLPRLSNVIGALREIYQRGPQ